LRELQLLVPHLRQFLNEQKVRHSFYVVHQVDNLRFNRGALLNLYLPPADYVALHDVDLLPVDPHIRYTWPGDQGPYHPIPARFHPRYYWYEKYFGGVLIITRKQFTRLNGMSNSFWGWGSEDDEFRRRVILDQQTFGKVVFTFSFSFPRMIIENHLACRLNNCFGFINILHRQISAPADLPLGRDAFRSIHDEKLHVRDASTYYDFRVVSLQLCTHFPMPVFHNHIILAEYVFRKYSLYSGPGKNGIKFATVCDNKRIGITRKKNVIFTFCTRCYKKRIE
uniref:Beta-1,4-galactosyltransferase 7 n=1 Tax=Echinostoma caproni TaxID=27848 RepID=A0A183A8T7_9TREM